MLLPCQCPGPLLGSWSEESACICVAEPAGLQFSWICVDLGLGWEMGSAAWSLPEVQCGLQQHSNPLKQCVLPPVTFSTRRLWHSYLVGFSMGLLTESQIS